MKKCITFTAPIEKEVTRVDKNGEEITKNVSYILQFIDNARLLYKFIDNSSSNLVNNLSEGIHRIKSKYGHVNKKLKFAELNISTATVFLNTWTPKMI